MSQRAKQSLLSSPSRLKRWLLAAFLGLSLSGFLGATAHAAKIVGNVDSSGLLDNSMERKIVSNGYGIWVFWDESASVWGSYSPDGQFWYDKFEVFPGTDTTGGPNIWYVQNTSTVFIVANG